LLYKHNEPVFFHPYSLPSKLQSATQKNLQSEMLFMPVADNPLHRNHLHAASNHVDTSYDSLSSNDWSSTWDRVHQKSSVGLQVQQQKSCLKASKPSYSDNLYQTGNSLQNSSLGRRPSIKPLVKWSTPLFTFRMIPARDDLLNDIYIESSNPNAEMTSQVNTIPNLPECVLEESNIISSSICLESAFSPPSQKFATQDENHAVHGSQLSSIKDSTLDIGTFSITKVENNIEEKLFGTMYFPLYGKAFEIATQAKISARNWSAGPVAFSVDGLDGPTYHENTTKLNLRHLSRSLSSNTPSAIHHSLSPNIPINLASTLLSYTFLPSTKSPNSSPMPIPSHNSQIFSKPSISIPQEAVHHYPPPIPQLTNNHPLDQIPNPPPHTKVFGSRKSNQQSQTSFPGAKRKAISVEPVKRPSKFIKVDQNIKESPIWQETSPSSSIDFPGLNKHGTMPEAASLSLSLPCGSVGQDSANANDVGDDSGAEGPVTSDNPDDDSENDSLFGDSFVNYKPGLVHPDKQDFLPANPVRSSSDKFRSKFKAPVRSYTPPITRLVVIRWVNELKRFQYLRDAGKLDEKIVAEIHQLLNNIDKQKGDVFLTPKVLGDTHLGRLVSEFRHGKHGKASKAIADGIVKFWRHRCREVESGYS
jgi:hypothetical protein